MKNHIIMSIVFLSIACVSISCSKKQNETELNKDFNISDVNEVSIQEQDNDTKDEELSNVNNSSEVVDATNETPIQETINKESDFDSQNNFSVALQGLEKNGYYFRDVNKPEKILSSGSRVDILDFPEDQGMLVNFPRKFEYDGATGRYISLVWINTSGKKFEDVWDTIVGKFTNKKTISSDDPAAFIDFQKDVELDGNILLKNNMPYFSEGRLNAYKKYEKVFIGYNFVRGEEGIIYLLRVKKSD